MPVDYLKLYYTLFDGYEKAACCMANVCIGKAQPADAYKLLVDAMQKAEELYLEQTDDEE